MLDLAKIAADSVRLQYQRSGDGRTFKGEAARRLQLAIAGRSGAEAQVPGAIQYGKGRRLPASAKKAALTRLAGILGGPA